MVKVLDAATGALVHSLSGHRSPAECVAFSPDGRTLVSSDTGGDLLFWNLATGQETLRLAPRSRHIIQVAFRGPRRLYAMYEWQADGETPMLILDASD